LKRWRKANFIHIEIVIATFESRTTWHKTIARIKYKYLGGDRMADINVNNLNALSISGSDLFEDLETFMVELSDDESVIGGSITNTIIPTSGCIVYGGGTCGVPKQDPGCHGYCTGLGITCLFSEQPF
jgi:hypothetical protein